MTHGELDVHQTTTPPASALGGGGLASPIDRSAELVADLIDAIGLLPADRLALTRSRSMQEGSFSEALVAEGLASSEGVARMLAARHRLPYVDLPVTGVAMDASVVM